GDPGIIENASYETIRRFYESWYRPDLMAVVAVGDFDPDAFESKIHEHFSTLSAPDELLPRATYDVPGHDETLYEVVTDPEYPIATVSVYYKRPGDQVVTMSDYRHRIVGSLFNDMLNDRLEEI